MRKHWSRLRAALGVLLLSLWTLLRVLSFGVVRWLHPRLRAGYETWARIWAERSAWTRPLAKPGD